MRNDLRIERVTLRFSKEELALLAKIAKENKKKVAHLLREMIDYSLKNIKRGNLTTFEKTHLQSTWEGLYILRGLADQIDPKLREKANEQARIAITENFEGHE